MRLTKAFNTGFLRTSAFRLTASFAALFVIAGSVLLSLVYREAMHYGLSEQDEILETAADSITGGMSRPDIATVVRKVNMRIAAADSFSPEYIIENRTGQAVAGNLPALAIVSSTFIRALPDPDEPGHIRKLRFYGTDLGNGYKLAVGQDLRAAQDVRELVHKLTKEFLLGGVLSLALMVIGSAIIMIRLTRRVEAIASATRNIMDGALDQRLPVSTHRDEFDTLSTSVNQMLDQLQEHVETVRQVSNDIAHDLRTPLTRLRRRLEALVDTTFDPANTQEIARRALTEADAILSTFSALLRIGQIEALHDRSHMTTVDLSALLAIVTEVYTPMFEEAGQHLETHIAAALALSGDRDLLAQMVGNLLENASRHGAHGGKASLSAQRLDDDTITIIVADDGPGIPANERERVLGRFYRLDRSRSTPGSGLGLSLAKAIANYHRGHLTLTDNDPGLCVTIDLLHRKIAAVRPENPCTNDISQRDI